MQRIVDWLAENFKRDEGIDLLKDKQALQRLTETAEKAKMELSSLTQTNIRYVSCILLFPSILSVCSLPWVGGYMFFYLGIVFWSLIDNICCLPVCLLLQPLQMAPSTLRPPLQGPSLRSCAQICLIGT